MAGLPQLPRLHLSERAVTLQPSCSHRGGEGTTSTGTPCDVHSASSRLGRRCSNGHTAPADRLEELPAALRIEKRLPCSSSFFHGRLPLSLPATLAAAAWPATSAAAEAVPPGLLRPLMDTIDSWGPAGGVVYAATVMGAEMIPLFPTTPLSLLSGLLFGAPEGALLVLLGTTGAATLSFLATRGVGRQFAQDFIKKELADGENGVSRVMAKRMAQVTAAIEEGNIWQQFAAVAALRLTPIVPFSATNYVLALTPLGFQPYIAATVLGMTVWASIYASIGSAGRVLLDQGAEFNTVFSSVYDEAGQYAEQAAKAALVAGLAIATAYTIQQKLRGRHGAEVDSSHDNSDEQEELERVK